MALVVQLEPLAPSASERDVRQFFDGLEIPPDGVQIAECEDRAAFVEFASNTSIVAAMKLTGKKILDQQVFVSLCTEEDRETKLKKVTTTSGEEESHEKPREEENEADSHVAKESPPAEPRKEERKDTEGSKAVEEEKSLSESEVSSTKKDTSTEDSSTKKSVEDDTSTEDSSTKKSVEDDTSTEDSSMKKSVGADTSTEDSSMKKLVGDDSSTEESSAKKLVGEDTSTEDSSMKMSVRADTSIEDSSVKKSGGAEKSQPPAKEPVKRFYAKIKNIKSKIKPTSEDILKFLGGLSPCVCRDGVVIRPFPNQPSMFNAYVQFKDEKSANVSLKLSGRVFQGEKVAVVRCYKDEQKKTADTSGKSPAPQKKAVEKPKSSSSSGGGSVSSVTSKKGESSSSNQSTTTAAAATKTTTSTTKSTVAVSKSSSSEKRASSESTARKEPEAPDDDDDDDESEAYIRLMNLRGNTIEVDIALLLRDRAGVKRPLGCIVIRPLKAEPDRVMAFVKLYADQVPVVKKALNGFIYNDLSISVVTVSKRAFDQNMYYRGKYIFLSEIPTVAKYSDIKKFFEHYGRSIPSDGIIIKRDKRNFHMLVAFIRFTNDSDFEHVRACGKRGVYMKGKKIRLVAACSFKLNEYRIRCPGDANPPRVSSQPDPFARPAPWQRRPSSADSSGRGGGDKRSGDDYWKGEMEEEEEEEEPYYDMNDERYRAYLDGPQEYSDDEEEEDYHGDDMHRMSPDFGRRMEAEEGHGEGTDLPWRRQKRPAPEDFGDGPPRNFAPGGMPPYPQGPTGGAQGQPGGPQGQPGGQPGHPVRPQGPPMQPQGHPVASQGHPVASQGPPMQPQAHPVTSQGPPMAPQAHPVGPQGHPVVPQGHPGVPQGQPMAPQGHFVRPQGHPGGPYPSAPVQPPMQPRPPIANPIPHPQMMPQSAPLQPQFAPMPVPMPGQVMMPGIPPQPQPTVMNPVPYPHIPPARPPMAPPAPQPAVQWFNPAPMPVPPVMPQPAPQPAPQPPPAAVQPPGTPGQFAPAPRVTKEDERRVSEVFKNCLCLGNLKALSASAIRNFFSEIGTSIMQDGIVVLPSLMNPGKYVAVVRFLSEDAFLRAMDISRNQKHQSDETRDMVYSLVNAELAARYSLYKLFDIQPTYIHETEPDQVFVPYDSPHPRRSPPPPHPGGSTTTTVDIGDSHPPAFSTQGRFIRVGALPYWANEDWLYAFLSGCKMVKESTHITYDKGMPIRAYMECATDEDVIRACKKDSTPMGKTYVTVKPLGKKK